MFFQALFSPDATSGFALNQAELLGGAFKLLFLLSLLFYAVFSVIVIRQVQIMKNTLITPVSPMILTASIIHLLVVIALFFFMLVLL